MDWVNVPAVKMTDLDDEAQFDDLSEIRVSSMSTIDKLTTEQNIRNFCRNSKRIECITLHHTWSPNSSQYNGRSTVLGIKRYHIQNVDARDIMANFYTSPVDDYIGWTARPMNITNGAHAYINKNWNQVPADLRIRANGNRQYLNYRSIGIETIANMDTENPATNKSMRNSIKLIAILCDIYNLDIDRDLYFHRDVAHKSCPGTKVDLDWVKSEVKKEMDNGEDCKKLPAKPYQEDALDWAKNTGLLVGDSDGNQMPQCNITRGDMLVVLKRFYDMFIDED
jgi:hypothetical protein